MWKLTSKTGIVYYLLPEKKKHSVGRSSADVALTGDTSISRSHASIYISKDSVKVVDVGSQHGTFCNENIENKVAIKKNVPIELKNGDRIQFGVLGNEWVLSQMDITTLNSTQNPENRVEVQKILEAVKPSPKDSLTNPQKTINGLKTLKSILIFVRKENKSRKKRGNINNCLTKNVSNKTWELLRSKLEHLPKYDNQSAVNLIRNLLGSELMK